MQIQIDVYVCVYRYISIQIERYENLEGLVYDLIVQESFPAGSLKYMRVQMQIQIDVYVCVHRYISIQIDRYEDLEGLVYDLIVQESFPAGDLKQMRVQIQIDMCVCVNTYICIHVQVSTVLFMISSYERGLTQRISLFLNIYTGIVEQYKRSG